MARSSSSNRRSKKRRELEKQRNTQLKKVYDDYKKRLNPRERNPGISKGTLSRDPDPSWSEAGFYNHAVPKAQAYRARVHRNVNKTQLSKKRYADLTNSPSFSIGDLRRSLNPQHEIKRIALCHARKIRKQVLHALKRTGKGSGNQPPKWKPTTDIKC